MFAERAPSLFDHIRIHQALRACNVGGLVSIRMREVHLVSERRRDGSRHERFRVLALSAGAAFQLDFVVAPGWRVRAKQRGTATFAFEVYGSVAERVGPPLDAFE